MGGPGCLLAEELHRWDDPEGRQWKRTSSAAYGCWSKRYLAYFPKQSYPIRSGVHSNTAFGLAFAIDYAKSTGRDDLLKLLTERSLAYYVKDEQIPAKWEPDGADFFSPSLMEADLMRRILPAAVFRVWLGKFLPELADRQPQSLLEPPHVSDRTDPQIVHLDGLSLSRAWCMRDIALALPQDDPVRKVLEESAARHAKAGLAHVASGDYAGEHWLASFAVYLCSSPEERKSR